MLVNKANIDAIFEHMGGKTMPEGMAADMLGNAGPINRTLYCFLQTRFKDMMPALFTRARIGAQVF